MSSVDLILKLRLPFPRRSDISSFSASLTSLFNPCLGVEVAEAGLG
ncbi:hypothetical protein E2C01_096410 [Portunus trituberculatus]|uniref:Uncharacterized protein n=1 Tax=Portunus trituberculatus TaxID=210409 RepID=A0A5B7K858_PORTR|nr:hypothetical protein [Portunus trituberculatus]